MLTKNEITALNLSPTKKDFVQIWNELLEVASKLSERWDPTSTNESDPGIVILKALTGIADKLNYNIDKNTLEAFMPTAAQEDSMRKLCDMLGYNIKYYRSAETTVTIKYHNSDPSSDEDTAIKNGLLIPKFTTITNNDKDINYFIINTVQHPAPAYIAKTSPSVTFHCIEGQLVKCESTTDNNVITTAQISENNRFYLPEAQVAENGIFIYNVYSEGASLADGTPWDKVDNLNIQARGARVFKFGYDSYESRPYVEFPSDYSELINDGLFIYYTRTNGANGNISPGTLTQLEKPSGENWDKVSIESFHVENIFAANTGANIESITQAYNNFKKTIGTFETLVTCRDYMNKIYMMTDDETGKPKVSNVLVTDIRNDLNRAITICSCDDAGIFYKETALTETTTKTFKRKNTVEPVEVEYEEPAINHFDLVLYPFKSYSQIKSSVKDIQEVYDSSFSYSQKLFDTLKTDLNENQAKTIAHNIVPPRKNDIISINNYLRLSAIIGTNSKITTEEGTLLKEKIKVALANAFNLRELDFGEEIPFESIVEVIEKSDSRIKVVSLNEPALYTTFSVFEGIDVYRNPIIKEYAVASNNWLTESEADATKRFEMQKDADGNYTGTFNTKKAKEFYNKLVVRNILAGRVPLFKYNNTFKTSFTEGAYRTTENIAYDALPSEMSKGLLSAENPSIIYVDNGKIYTAKRTELNTKPDNLLEKPTTVGEKIQEIDQETGILYVGELPEGSDAPIYYTITCTKTSAPTTTVKDAEGNDNEVLKYPDNLIIKNANDDNNFTEITTSCKIRSDMNSSSPDIKNVTLAEGEFVKFRAPNFITTKTYPAYVNYHLALNAPTENVAKNAEADKLFNLLRSENARNNVLTYFAMHGQKKTFTLTQKVLAKSWEIKNTSVPSPTETPESLLKKSGFVRLLNDGNPIIKYVDTDEVPNIDSEVLEALKDVFSGWTSWFIDNPSTFNDPDNGIKTKVDTILSGLESQGKDWTISYEFEYVPFEPSNLKTWETFVKQQFNPKEDLGTVLWRVYAGSYATGKYILSDTSKLLPFTSNYFSQLDLLANRLEGIYIASDLGENLKPTTIGNKEEYKLREGEYLYIEYTPSTTSEDGTAKISESVKEVYGPGAIIKPNGFEEGLIDSSISGRTVVKQVSFDGKPDLNMFSFGANEQVEIREYARVVLNKDLFTDSAAIYIYKNFNNCPELETIPNDGSGYDTNGKRINSTYTLKDGEYIFYTDKNKTELAYYTSGTEITLTGRTVIPKCEIIDLATIFESGIDAIPWVALGFSSNNVNIEPDSVIFQEYQYLMLGPKDTINDLTILGQNNYLSDQYQYCDNVSYTVAGSAGPDELPKINTYGVANTGCGWEACSVLELNVSPTTAQTLRKTAQVETSVTLSKTSASGSDGEKIVLAAENEQQPLSFKTNLTCQSSTGKVKLEDIYVNPNNLKSFELKVFSEETPVIIRTTPRSIAPYVGTNSATVIKPSALSSSTVVNNELLSKVALSDLKSVKTEEEEYDRALKLCISILPNTYGIFSVYLDSNEESATWIDLMPGADRSNITLFNATDAEIEAAWKPANDTKDFYANDRLMLKPGLNCIKINTSCDIYFKTVAESSGMLYFDELRLVDCAQIAYHEKKDSKAKYVTTQGLNLDQLGYFLVDKEEHGNGTFNVFDRRVRKSLKAEFAKEALDSLKEKEVEASTAFDAAWHALLAVKPKAKAVADYLDKAIAELNTLYKDTLADPEDVHYRNGNSLAKLLSDFNSFKNDLAKELALKKALGDAKSIEDLEQQLLDLLGNSEKAETSKQDLLAKLEELRDAALSEAENFCNLPKEVIINDAVTYADNTDKTLLADFKLACITKIDAQFNESLNTIKQSITEASTNSENLNVALESLHVGKQKEVLQQIQSLITETSGTLVTTATDVKTLAEGKTTSEGANTITLVSYRDVASKLTELRRQARDFDIGVLVSEIEYAAESGLYKELSEAISELKTILTAEDSLLIKNIDAVLAMVQSKLTDDDQDYDSSLVNKIQTNIIDVIQTRATGRIITIITDIQNIINNALDDFADLKDKLKSAEDLYIDSIENVVTVRNQNISLIDNLAAITKYAIVPFGEEALLAIWPKRMTFYLINEVDILCQNINAALATGGVEQIIADRVDSEPFKSAINIDAFKDLFNEAIYLAQHIKQNTRREELIDELSEKIALTPELTNKMLSMKIERNTALQYILNRLSDSTNKPTASEKSQLFKKLSEELDSVITFDTKLVEVVASILCPSILLYDQKISDNSFYDELCKFVSTSYNYLITEAEKDPDGLNMNTVIHKLLTDFADKLTKITVISDVFDNASLAELKTKTYESADFTAALIPDCYELVQSVDSTIINQDVIAQIKQCNLLVYITKDLRVAWQVNDGTWVDSSGTIIAADQLDDFDIKHDLSGTWTALNVGAEAESETDEAEQKTDEPVKIQDNDGTWIIGFKDKKGYAKVNLNVTEFAKELQNILDALLKKAEQKLDPAVIIEGEYAEVYNALILEEQLLGEIREIDKDRLFYYNVPVESNMAIDFNESDPKLNTLMNPAINYDINNVNNSFVISKLDINYLTNGLQIARSSRIS